jgi:pimeloyl-ACP methyl ester carboxylesterase
MQRSSAPRAVALPDGRILSFAMFGDPGGGPVLAIHDADGSHTVWSPADAAARRCHVCLIAPDRPAGPDDLAVLADAVFVEDLRLVTLGAGAEHGLAAAHTLRPRVSHLALLAPDGPVRPVPCRTRRWDGPTEALLADLDPVLAWLLRP